MNADSGESCAGSPGFLIQAQIKFNLSAIETESKLNQSSIQTKPKLQHGQTKVKLKHNQDQIKTKSRLIKHECRSTVPQSQTEGNLRIGFKPWLKIFVLNRCFHNQLLTLV